MSIDSWFTPGTIPPSFPFFHQPNMATPSLACQRVHGPVVLEVFPLFLAFDSNGITLWVCRHCQCISASPMNGQTCNPLLTSLLICILSPVMVWILMRRLLAFQSKIVLTSPPVQLQSILSKFYGDTKCCSWFVVDTFLEGHKVETLSCLFWWWWR